MNIMILRLVATHKIDGWHANFNPRDLNSHFIKEISQSANPSAATSYMSNLRLWKFLFKL